MRGHRHYEPEGGASPRIGASERRGIFVRVRLVTVCVVTCDLAGRQCEGGDEQHVSR